MLEAEIAEGVSWDRALWRGPEQSGATLPEGCLAAVLTLLSCFTIELFEFPSSLHATGGIPVGIDLTPMIIG